MRSLDNISSRELDRLLDSHEIISFDIFGTLLVRAVATPDVVFDIVEAEATGAPFVENTEFRSLRSAAEHDDEGNTASLTLEEIYARIDLSDDDRAKRMELEKDVESRVLFPNPQVKEVYDKAVKRGKTIVIASDMYLSAGFLADLLHQNGYQQFDKLFVSCEYGKNKGTGELFDEIMNHYGQPARAILHIGDNLHADISGAKKRGIKTLYVGEPLVAKAQKKLGMRSASPAVFGLRFPQESVWFNWGFASLGPLLVAFSQWLHDSEECRGRRLFFLARDAKLLYDTHSLLYPGEEPTPYYLYLSRRSVYLACIPDIEELASRGEELDFQRYISWATFMDDLGIDEAVWKNALSDEQVVFDELKHKEDFFHDPDIERMYAKMLPVLREMQSQQRELLREYLSDAGFDSNAVIVDIGWHGSIQKLLERLFGCDLQGFYMGMFETDGRRAKGYLFDGKGQENESIIAAFTGLFETLFFAGHGTTLSYEEDSEGAARPKLGPCEYTEKESANLGDLQRGALQFVKMAVDSRLVDYYRWNVEEVMVPFKKLALNPSKGDVDLFGPIGYLDHGKVKPLASDDIGPTALLRPRKFYKDFFHSAWKAAYLQRTFRVPLPYGKWYLGLRKAVKRKS